MASVSEEQCAQLAPPRRGAVWAVTVDSTARSYDLSSIALAGFTPDAAHKTRQQVILYLQAETASVYFYFDSVTGSALADTASQSAAAAAVAFADTYGAVIPAGSFIAVRVDRSLDKFLTLKAASTSGVLRMWAISESR